MKRLHDVDNHSESYQVNWLCLKPMTYMHPPINLSSIGLYRMCEMNNLIGALNSLGQ